MYAGGFVYWTEISLTLPKANMAIRCAHSMTVCGKPFYIPQIHWDYEFGRMRRKVVIGNIPPFDRMTQGKSQKI